MASTSGLVVMTAESKFGIHAFFQQNNGSTQMTEESFTQHQARDEPPQYLAAHQLDAVSVERQNITAKDRVPGQTPSNGTKKTQRTLIDLVIGRNVPDQPATPHSPIGSEIEDAESSEDRRKRRRTKGPGDVNSNVEATHTKFDQASSDFLAGAKLAEGENKEALSSPQTPEPASPQPTERAEIRTLRTPPKKQLRLKPNGKFSSPISKAPEQPVEQGDARVSKKKGKNSKASQILPKTLSITVIHYGKDENVRHNLGRRIDRILNGEEWIAKEPKLSQKGQPSHQSKPTHPFFLDKSQVEPPEKKDSPRKASTVTPGKLRAQRLNCHGAETQESVPLPSLGSGLLRDRLMMKHTGSKEAPFPPKGQAHIRGLGLGFDEVQPPPVQGTANALSVQRKQKQAKRHISESDSILARFVSRLRPEAAGRLRPDGYTDPHPSLRIPERLILCSQEISTRVMSETSDGFQHSGTSAAALASKQSAHPALHNLSEIILNYGTSLVEDKSEHLLWMQKYAPSKALHVLQSKQKMTVLKDWLNSLVVQSVCGGVSQRHALGPRPKFKRIKRNDDLDDFLVENDEDLNDLVELDEGNGSMAEPNIVKSVAQSLSGSTKLNNAVLLSGPHGCGKTAAAYAVAKELGFKVFEVNSSERRNGRDVYDKIGDMAENHLVKHHGTDDEKPIPDEMQYQVEEAFQRDLESGRQGKMHAFFKPAAKAKLATTKTNVQSKKLEAIKAATTKPSKEQQQSLILLEEVDILFKEDKDFWTVALKLITDSKRPFILTCNDEDLVPYQTIKLHAILRFSPPSIDLAADYMLLIAAAEGHLLKRRDVESLYQLTRHDLRASITQLNYWCQMGIGDPKSGLSWIYQRYPPGADLDDQGRKLRVASDRTYQASMGLMPEAELSYDSAVSRAWDKYDMNPEISADFDRHQQSPLSALERLSVLNDAVKLSESLSASDIYTMIGLPDTAPFDTTQPELSDKVRIQSIETLPLLQINETVNYSNLSQDLLTSSTLSACSVSRLWSSSGLPWVDKDRGLEILRDLTQSRASSLSRRDFSCFDIVAMPPPDSASLGMVQSAFDGPFKPIVLDLAPYVRSIVQFEKCRDEYLEDLERFTASIGGGRQAKRARTTRAARSALQGSQRASTRREKWFAKALDGEAVLATGSPNWPRPMASAAPSNADFSGHTSDAPSSSADSAGPRV